MRSKALHKVIAWPMVVVKRRAYRRFLASLSDPAAAQARKLESLLAQMRDSAFARDFGLARVRNGDDLRRALPIAPFERMAPYVERVKNGDITALFRAGTRVRMFAATSGTTAASKHIPVTSLSLAEYLASWSIWGYGVAADYPEIPYAGVINMASSARSSMTASGVPIGSVTGMLTEIMDKIIRSTHAVPPAVANIADAEARYYVTLRLALARQDVMMINVANPATLLILADRMALWSDSLLKDLRDGTLKDESNLPPAVRRRISSLLRPNPALAKDLASRAANAALTPRVAWPDLKLLGVWTGGTLGAYLSRLSAPYGPAAIRDHGLSASEGRVTLPLADGTPSGVLNLEGAYYEFVPDSEYGAPAPRALGAHELDRGQRYYVVLTTSGGLVRYDLSDVVECVGHRERTPLLKFLNKGRHIANLTGEKLSAYQVTEAMTAVNAALNLPFREYILAPLMGMTPNYVLLFEETGAPDGALAGKVAAALDAELCRRNIEYAERRASRRLAPAEVSVVPDGTFLSLRDAQAKRAGTPVEHYKHPFLMTDPAFMKTYRSA